MSIEPLLPATVEKRANTGVRSPTSVKIFARVYFASDFVSSKYPCAAEPRACTMRSGMRSWSKCMIFSRRMKSSSSVGPRGPCFSEFWLSAMTTPWLVVSGGRLPPACCWYSPPLPRGASNSGSAPAGRPTLPAGFALGVLVLVEGCAPGGVVVGVRGLAMRCSFAGEQAWCGLRRKADVAAAAGRLTPRPAR